MPVNKSIRSLPLRPNIHEAKYSGKQFTRGDINHEIGKLVARFPHKRFQVLLPYESWREGNWFSSDAPISLFSLADYYDESQFPDECDPEIYSEFLVYITDPLPQVGGCIKNDSKNDCLYHCLFLAYGTRSRLPWHIKTPELLKEKLGLKRNDPISTTLMSRVEELAGTIAINISGDYIYHSKRKCKRTINLILSNGHYSIAKNPDRTRLKAWYSVPKQPVIYEANGIKNTVKYYNGHNFWDSNIKELRKLKSERWSGKWCFVKKEKILSFEETYSKFNEERDALLEKSKRIGLPIDLLMCCGSYKIAALWLFEKLSQSVQANEALDPIEAQWISNAMKGGIIWAENDWKGYGREYDFTSMYPYLLQKYFFPISKGEFKTIQNIYYTNREKQFIYYGLFLAEVEYRKDMLMLFRYNSKNIYTHHDLTRAEKLGLKVILNKNGPNALIYKTYPGSVMFGAYIEMLFKIKSEGCPASSPAKRILNMLWGALCEKSFMSYEIGQDTKWTKDNPFDIPEGERVNSIIPLGKENWTMYCSKPDNLFKGEYPRIAPFLLALGRKLISETIEPYKNYLKRVHTDGFILEDISIPVNDNANTTLGRLKFEKEGLCHVKNANQVIWS